MRREAWARARRRRGRPASCSPARDRSGVPGAAPWRPRPPQRKTRRTPTRSAPHLRGGAGWAGVAPGTNGNGYIGGNNTTDGTEGHEAWQALKYAGLLAGDPAATGNAHLPGHPFGGKFYFTNMDFGSGIGRKNTIMCNNLPGGFAEIIDIKFDDRVYNTGTVRANNVYTTASVNLYYAL